MESFFSMGGYAPYVWSAYGAAALILAVMGAASWRAYKKARSRLDKLQ